MEKNTIIHFNIQLNNMKNVIYNIIQCIEHFFISL